MADSPVPGPAPPLRILQVNSAMTGGGTDDQCVKLALALHQLGQTSALAGPDDREVSRVVRQLGLPFHPTPPEGKLKRGFILAVARLIRRERIQIVHGHHGRDLWPAILAARLAGTRPQVVLSRHLAKSPGSWPSRHLLLRCCAAVIAVSEFVARILREGVADPHSPEKERHWRGPIRGPLHKIRVIHGGIDTDRFQPADAAEQRRQWGLAPDDFAFGVVGAYGRPRGKGQREFLAAAARIAPRLPHARFLIVGRGDLGDQLRSDIARLGLTGRAWLTPYSQDMPAAMNALDCLVHPQVGTEAFAVVVLEALACGRPVIASALDGIPEAFAAGNYGCLVPPESIDELAAALVDWGARPRPTDAERAALHARVAAEYSTRAFGGRMLRCYRELLAGG